MTGTQAGCIALLASSGAYFFSLPLADNDLWGHIFFGREILAASTLPLLNTYSYTAPSHPWINHEILAECVFAWVFDTVGPRGLLLFKLAIGMATLMVMARTVARRAADPLAATAVLVLGASMMSFGFMVRPQIFSFLALALLWDRLNAYADGHRSGIWWLPVLFVFWVNTHGAVVAGMAILLAFAVLHAVGEGRLRERLDILAVVSVSMLALVVNPYGIQLPEFIARDLLLDRPITEWSGVSPFDASDLPFKLAVLAYATWAIAAPRRRWWEIGTVCATAVATFRHQRHLPLFAVVAAPALAEASTAAIRRIRGGLGGLELSRFSKVAILLGVAMICAVQVSWVIELQRSFGLQIFVSPDQFPVDSVRFIRRNHLAGNLALPFDWGEYAIWHLYPSCRVSIDGRYTTAYPQAVIDDAWRFMEGTDGWDRALEGASLALVDRKHGTAAKLFQSPAWQYIYSDRTALLFVRKGTPLPATLDRRPRIEPEGAFFFP